jgi:hypothetical protein
VATQKVTEASPAPLNARPLIKKIYERGKNPAVMQKMVGASSLAVDTGLPAERGKAPVAGLMLLLMSNSGTLPTEIAKKLVASQPPRNQAGCPQWR